MKERLRFFIDFDGTITDQDAVDLVLEKFAQEEWRSVEKKWAKGNIGSRECLSLQMDLVSATRAQVLDLAGTITVDPKFVSFLRTLRLWSIPVVIVSDGFDVIIQEVLKKALRKEPELLKNLPIYSNRLLWISERKVRPVFLSGINTCAHGCANCKVRVIEKIKSAKEKIIFVGDGLSDRFAAAASNLVFAKKKLLEFCRQENIAHQPYDGFRKIQDWVLQQAVAARNVPHKSTGDAAGKNPSLHLK